MKLETILPSKLRITFQVPVGILRFSLTNWLVTCVARRTIGLPESGSHWKVPPFWSHARPSLR